MFNYDSLLSAVRFCNAKTNNLFIPVFYKRIRVLQHSPKQKAMSKRKREDLSGVIMPKRQTTILIA